MEKLLEKLKQQLHFLGAKYSIKIQDNNIIITSDEFVMEFIRCVLNFCEDNDIAFYVSGKEMVIYKHKIK